MKRMACFFLVLALAFLVVACSAPTVVFTDPVLENKVRSAMNKPEGKIAIAEAQALTELNLSTEWQPNIPENTQIKNISALKHFSNLTRLDLTFNAISDLTPLAGLTKLSSLHLGGNALNDIKALAGLNNLWELQIWGNRDIKDITPLSGLIHLSVLRIGGTQVSNIGIVSSMKELTMLDITDSQVKDLSPLVGLPLQSLRLKGSLVTDFDPIKDMSPQLDDKDFELLSADGVPNTPLVLADPKFEKALRAAMNILDRPITQKDAFLAQSLFIGNDKTPGSAFADISPLAHFVNLTSLEFNSNNISNLEPLRGLTKLTVLRIPFNKVQDIRPLASLSQLETLDLCHNQITDVSALSGLKKLRFLSLRENPISSFTPLKDIYPNLTSKDFELK